MKNCIILINGPKNLALYTCIDQNLYALKNTVYRRYYNSYVALFC